MLNCEAACIFVLPVNSVKTRSRSQRYRYAGATGVGVAYSIKKRSLLFTIASLRRPEGWPAGLSHHLQEALLDMQALCEHAATTASKL